MARAIRLPLQTGATSLSYLLYAQIGAAGMAAGIALLGVPFVGLVLFGIGCGVLGYFVRVVRRRRASDVLLSDDAIEIAAGPKDLLFWEWRTVASARIDEDRSQWRMVDDRKTYLRKLVVGMRDNSEETLAESVDPDEHHSMEVLARAIRFKIAPTAAAAPPATAEIAIVTCQACGAAVPPCDAESVRCPHCEAVVTMPAAVRDRMKRSDEVVRKANDLETAIAMLRRQPGAHATNRLLFGFAVMWLGVAPIAVFALLVKDAPSAVLLLASGLLAAWSFAQADVSRRVALRAIMTGFGAGPPASAKASATCRRCGAPLPEPPEGRTLVKCAYCDADNVLGLDLLPVERDLAAESLDATAAFDAQIRAAAARKWRTLIAAGLCAAWVILAIHAAVR